MNRLILNKKKFLSSHLLSSFRNSCQKYSFSTRFEEKGTNSEIIDAENKIFENKQILKLIKRGKDRENYYKHLKINNTIAQTNFKLDNIHQFPEYEMTGYSLTHNKTGSRYFHIDSSDMNNGFSIHFTTPAFDNTGVFHILEHLALCGSKKFPVRDPFMNMIKRSLNSYMNAWTGCDFTMYPFAAVNPKDYSNLREVYVDACFNPNLNYLDFLQEGWRFEFLEPNNRKSGLLYKGVVLNEMKGDMSKQDSYFIQKLQSNLFKNSTYNFNSGGDPKFIPTLKYENLVKAHQKYYNPTNSKFISYGDLNFLENLDFLESEILSNYPENKDQNKIFVPLTQRLSEPKEVIEYYQPEMSLGSSSNEKPTAKMAISYLINDVNADTYLTFKLSILSHLLLEGPNSIMFKTLIESGLAPGYSHGYGYDISLREGMMTFGVANIENDYRKFKEIENAIFEGLNQAFENGFKMNLIEEVLHLIEYDSKKPRDDFAVNFLNQSSGFITHSIYPFTMFRANEYSRRLRNELVSDPKLFNKLVKEHLIDNKHRVKLILRPKEDIITNMNREEFESLNRIDERLTNEDVDKIIKEAELLSKHQHNIQDLEILPCLQLSDIPPFVEHVSFEKTKLPFEINLTYFPQPTNGVSFIRFKTDISKIPEDLKEYIPMYTLILPQLGTKHHSYEEFQNLLKTNSPGLDINLDLYSDIHNSKKEFENLIFEFSFLDTNLDKAMALYEEMFSVPNFFDFTNLNQIIKQESVRIANEITNNSLHYAMSYASAGFKNNKAQYEEFKADMFLCKLGSEIMQLASPKERLKEIAEKLYLLHNLIFMKRNIEVSYHGNEKLLEGIKAKLSLILNSVKNENEVFSNEMNVSDEPRNEFKENFMKVLIQTPAQVCECVEVFKIPNYSHPDYAKCVLFANMLGLNILHKEIREKGGAYGSGASPSDSGYCVFYSYRDPKPERTYKIFEKGIIDIAQRNFKINEKDLRDCKIFIFSQIDKVINPANKGLSMFYRHLTEEDRNIFRQRLIEVTEEDVVEMANKYFIPQLEEGTTSRVLFGEITKTEDTIFEDFVKINSTDFLSDSYFKDEEDENS
jgi:Zn-dependent M16 (insulinase) family peptidase